MKRLLNALLTYSICYNTIIPAMPSLYRKKGSPFWWVRYKKNGKWIDKTTREKDKENAEQIKRKIEESIYLEKQNRLSAEAKRRIAQDILGDAFPQKTLKDFLISWLTNKKNETSKATFEKYKEIVKEFLAFMKSLGKGKDFEIQFIKLEDIHTYRNFLIGKGLSNVTINSKMKILKDAFEQARKEHLISENPIEFLKPLKEDKQKREPFTDEQVNLLYETAEGNPEWQSLIVFGYYTGQRLSDLATLSWGQIDLTPGQEKVSFKQKKTKNLVVISLHNSHLLDFIRKKLLPKEASEKVHPHSFAKYKKAGKVNPLSKEFSQLLIQAGLKEPETRKEHKKGHSTPHVIHPYSFHSLRHTRASTMINGGISAEVAKSITGHSSSQSISGYTHPDTKAQSDAMNLGRAFYGKW